MKRKQWQGQHHSSEMWLAKLGEEFGEVSKAYVQLLRGKGTLVHLLEELEHVEFIARCAREDIEKGVFQ